MELTKSKLKQIIKEEIEKALKEAKSVEYCVQYKHTDGTQKGALVQTDMSPPEWGDERDLRDFHRKLRHSIQTRLGRDKKIISVELAQGECENLVTGGYRSGY